MFVAASAKKQQEQGCSQGRGARSSLCTGQGHPHDQTQSPAMGARAGGDGSGPYQHNSSKVIHGKPNISSGTGLRQSRLQLRQELDLTPQAWRLNGAPDREGKCEAKREVFGAVMAN